MSAFARLSRAAVVGTQQSPGPIVLGDTDADAIVAQNAGETPERALLRAAAIVSTLRRATKAAKTFGERPEAAPDESFARCGPLAASDLTAALAAPDVLREWLRIAKHFEARVPEELLPALLDFGVRATADRAAIVAVAGERGRWLANDNDAWAYARATAPEPSDAFDVSGDRTARAAELRRMRTANAHAARAALEATWPSESSEDRAVLLEALGTGLSLADEPFLERARADARKDVRKMANELLHRLPESQAAARAIALATPFLRVRRGLLGREFIVRLPETFAPEMKAEGIEQKPPHGTGERAFWLQQALAIVPVAHWLSAFDLSFEKLFAIARKNEFAQDLLTGFTLALDTYRDRDDRAKLLDLAARDDFYVDWALRTRVRLDPHEAGEAPFLEALRLDQPRATQLLDRAPRRWGVALSTAALAAARSGLARAGTDWQEFQNRAALFALLARNVDPQTPGIEAGWPESYGSEKLRELVEQLLDRLRMRGDMYAHLKDGV